MSRPPWDRYFMSIAEAVAQRASCPRLSVGAILVRDKRIIATSYNGAPTGQETCLDVGCDIVSGHCVRARHAEENLVSVCARYGIVTQDAVVYCTHEPCDRCAGILRQAGIVKAYYKQPYPPTVHTTRWLDKRGVALVRV